MVDALTISILIGEQEILEAKCHSKTLDSSHILQSSPDFLQLINVEFDKKTCFVAAQKSCISLLFQAEHYVYFEALCSPIQPFATVRPR